MGSPMSFDDMILELNIEDVTRRIIAMLDTDEEEPQVAEVAIPKPVAEVKKEKKAPHYIPRRVLFHWKTKPALLPVPPISPPCRQQPRRRRLHCERPPFPAPPTEPTK